MVAVNLQARGYRVKQFDHGEATLAGVSEEVPDLIVLDVMMPGISGIEVAHQVRQSSRVPILMLSVKGDVSIKSTALDEGADDYLTKPFEVQELLARVRALLRRATLTREEVSANVYRINDLCVDLENTLVTVSDQTVKLTPREWHLLRVMVEHHGQVLNTRQLLQEAWGPEYGDEGDYIRTYITRLRRKLEPDPKRPQYILLVRGIGYRMA